MPNDTVQLNGFAVRAIRKARRLKQQQVAVLAEISGSYYSEIESSAKVNVSRPVLDRLLFALSIDDEDERAITRWWVISERSTDQEAA